MKLVVTAVLLATGCGAILNDSSKTAVLPPGATINGQGGAVSLSQGESYQVQFPDGHMCVIQSGVSIGWAVCDVLFTGLLGVVVDAATGDWKTLSADSCPGVALN